MFKTNLLLVTTLVLCLSACGSDSKAPVTQPPAPLVTPNSPPTIATIEAFSLEERASATVTIEAADSDGEIVSIEWSQTTGPTINVEDNQAGMLTLTAPEVGRGGATAEFLVVVTDDDGAIEQMPFLVTIVNVNLAPVAEAGDEQSVIAGNEVALSGTESFDPDGTQLTYQWSLSAPQGSVIELEASGDEIANFVPDIAGTYVAQLIVTDEDGATDSDQVEIFVEAANMPPVAEAGDNQSVRAGNGVRLSGSDSFDPDGTQISYRWTLNVPGGSLTELIIINEVITDFVPDIAGTYVAQLLVTDEDSATDFDLVEILVEAENMRPVADAGDNLEVATGNSVLLSARESYDPEGAPISYLWRLVAPDTSTAELDDPSSITPDFFADVDGQYSLFLIVNDGEFNSTEDSILVVATTQNAAPVADAGADKNGSRAIEVMLNADNSYDPEGDLLTYSWSITSQPENSDLSLIDVSTPTPFFTPFEFGNYVLSLTVSDGEQSNTDTTVITVVEGDIYIDFVERENFRYFWPFTGFAGIGKRAHEGATFEFEPLAFIATGSDFKIRFSAVDRNGVTTAFCGELYDGQIIKADEPFYFTCGIDVVKDQEFDIEFKISVEGYSDRIWTYVWKGTFI
jgi:hypothetical protein